MRKTYEDVRYMGGVTKRDEIPSLGMKKGREGENNRSKGKVEGRHGSKGRVGVQKRKT